VSVDEIVLLSDETPIAELDELRPLIAGAQERGYLTFAEIETCLEEVEVTKEQVHELHAYLDEHGIVVVGADGRPAKSEAGSVEASAESASEPDPDMHKKVEVDLTVEPSLDSLRLYLRAIGRVNLLTAEQEVLLARRIERGDMLAKQQMIEANLRLVVSIAKRHVGQGDNFFELVSDGNMSLIRAVEKFDFARGNKFSTYASWAIMKNFARTIPDEHRRKDRFRTSHTEIFYSTEERRSDQYEQESAQTQRERQIGKILERLDEREQRIIISRFGLDHGHEPLTLKEVGAEMGVTKERVRQIEARALSKLRVAAQEEKIDVPGAG